MYLDRRQCTTPDAPAIHTSGLTSHTAPSGLRVRAAHGGRKGLWWPHTYCLTGAMVGTPCGYTVWERDTRGAYPQRCAQCWCGAAQRCLQGRPAGPQPAAEPAPGPGPAAQRTALTAWRASGAQRPQPAAWPAGPAGWLCRGRRCAGGPAANSRSAAADGFTTMSKRHLAAAGQCILELLRTAGVSVSWQVEACGAE